MPTGYTSVIADGTCTFEQFALRCARNFGATISLRDESINVPIPDEFRMDEHYFRHLQKQLNALAVLHSLTRAQRSAAARKAHAERLARRNEYTADRLRRKARYEEMLVKISEWTPPSQEHVELKKFMLMQVEESLRFDCSPDGFDAIPRKPTIAQWYADALTEAEDDVAYAAKSYADALKRTRASTKWVRELRESLESTK